jgi:ketosteroid isomerase-like protein
MTKTSQVPTMQDMVARFGELAREEKWFEIQDEFFSDDVESIEPAGSPYMGYAKGKAAVRKKADDFVKRIKEVHGVQTSPVVTAGNHIAVGRCMDLTVEGLGRIKIDEIMLYEVKDGQIISEQFFY